MKGSITTEYVVWCDKCANWERSTTSKTKAGAAKHFAKWGWKRSRVCGWICPACQEAQRKSMSVRHDVILMSKQDADDVMKGADDADQRMC